MNIRLELAESLSQLEEIRELYLTAFPPDERRNFEGFIKQFLEKKDCEVFLAKNQGITIGFLTRWSFEAFCFIEHFAIMPGMRGQKAGETILKKLVSASPKPIVLETELPTNEISKRRIGFYQRQGFFLHDHFYIQPSYDGIMPGPELKLMSTLQNPGTELLKGIAETIRANVYWH